MQHNTVPCLEKQGTTLKDCKAHYNILFVQEIKVAIHLFLKITGCPHSNRTRKFVYSFNNNGDILTKFATLLAVKIITRITGCSNYPYRNSAELIDPYFGMQLALYLMLMTELLCTSSTFRDVTVFHIKLVKSNLVKNNPHYC